MNGLDMLQKIRVLDKDIPIIFITARNESAIIIKAIELKVVDYIIKPLNINELNKVINKTCEEIYLKNRYKKEHRELKIYLKKIEQIALIAKLNLEGNITYLNNNYINILGYKNEEILNENYEILKDEQSNSNLYKDLWETIRNGKIWEGTLKNCTKNGEIIYEKSTIMPIFDETNKNIIEYICINYLITDQEKEKKLLNKKMIQNIAYFKKENYVLSQEKQRFYNDTVDLKKYIFSMENEIKSFVQNKIYLLNQLEVYELNSLNQTNRKLNLVRNKNKEIEKFAKTIPLLKINNLNLIEKIEGLNITIIHHENLISLYKKNEEKLLFQIKELKDLNTNLDIEKAKINKKKSFF